MNRNTSPPPTMKAANPKTSMKLVTKPRRFEGANSARSVVAPAPSPPAAKPCTSRTSTSRIGASSPTLW
ncbi:hypothetical protein NY588_02295 [Curtobacterium flaccumfaciens pv. beticola]|nr:hypothetical protein [Curtobacterium flaccumfaciens pv. basellae]